MAIENSSPARTQTSGELTKIFPIAQSTLSQYGYTEPLAPDKADTDYIGEYRYPRLAPGRYNISIPTFKEQNVQVRFGGVSHNIRLKSDDASSIELSANGRLIKFGNQPSGMVGEVSNASNAQSPSRIIFPQSQWVVYRWGRLPNNGANNNRDYETVCACKPQ